MGPSWIYVEKHILSERQDECLPKLMREVVITVLLYISHSPVMVCALLKKEGSFKYFLLFILTVLADEAIVFAGVIHHLVSKQRSDYDCLLKDEGLDFVTR